MPPESEGLIARFDAEVDGWFDQVRHNGVVNRVFYVASEMGDWSKLWHLVGAVRILIDRDDLANVLGISAALGAESLIVNQGIKRLFRRQRPTAHFERPHHLRQPSTSSFPSGHASSATVAAILLIDAEPKLAPVWVALAATVAASRIHVKIHHASDVVGGVAVGLVLGAVARRLVP